MTDRSSVIFGNKMPDKVYKKAVKSKKKYIKKYHGNQLKEKIIDTLLRKGYNYEHIKELLNEEGALNDE